MLIFLSFDLISFFFIADDSISNTAGYNHHNTYSTQSLSHPNLQLFPQQGVVPQPQSHFPQNQYYQATGYSSSLPMLPIFQPSNQYNYPLPALNHSINTTGYQNNPPLSMQLPPTTNPQANQSHQTHRSWRPYELESSPTMSDHSHIPQSNPHAHSANHMSTMSRDGQLDLSTTSPGLPLVTQQSAYQRINDSSLSASNLESTSGEVLTSIGTPQTQSSSDGSRHASPHSGKSMT